MRWLVESQNRHQIAECYMAFGGVVYYWSLLEKGLSVAQNIDRLFFSPNGALRGEYFDTGDDRWPCA